MKVHAQCSESSAQNGWSAELQWGVLRRDKEREAANFRWGQVFQSLEWHTNEFEVFFVCFFPESNGKLSRHLWDNCILYLQFKKGNFHIENESVEKYREWKNMYFL